ncbi:MAG: hypothetical protein ACPGQS_00935 [Bradymonadia bacterium]
MNRYVKSVLLLLAFAFCAPAVVSAGPLDVKKPTIKKVKKTDRTKKALKLKNNRRVKAFNRSPEGKLLKKRLGKTKLVRRVNADKLKKTKQLKKVRAKNRAKVIKAGKKLDKATKIKRSKKKSPTR